MKIQSFFICQTMLLVIVILSSCSSTRAYDKKLPPPNIVWLVSEDNSMHYMKMFNDNGIATPNIESLSDQGLIYTRAFSNAAVCSAARSTIISGSYGPRLASHYHRNIEKVSLSNTTEMFPAYLKRAGYYTSNNSKEDYNFKKPDNVWDDSSKKASWKNRAENQPFFHVFNMGVTHESGLHFKKEDVDNKKTITNLDAFTVQPNHPNTHLFKYTNAVYRDKTIQMDTELGKVVQQLKEDGLYDNTFIFYYGDHGGVLPGSKGYIYETGLHVPMVVHVPKNYKHLAPNKLGSKVEGFVSFVDLAPTVLNLAGIKIPEGMDGKPFLGKSITAEDVNNRDETFSYADRFDEKYDMVRAVRKGKYKYIRNYQPFNFDGLMNVYRYKQLAYQEWAELYKSGKLNKIQSRFFEPKSPEMLFDVEKDPYETNNLVLDPEYKDEVLKLRERLDFYIGSMPDLSFYPEYYLIDNAFDNPEKFGQDHKSDILRYKNIADLNLLNFDEAKPLIEKALNSNDTWDRYWALIVCSSFGQESISFTSKIKEMAIHDKEGINRVRAYEYMGLVLNENTLNNMADVLYKSKSKAEALLILNSMALLTDSNLGYRAKYNFEQLPKSIKQNTDVKNRLDYLDNSN
jgi:arylsulfatase A-like enzyme